jgi:hypothetical protein
MGWLSPLSPALAIEAGVASLAFGRAPHEIAAWTCKRNVARSPGPFKGFRRCSALSLSSRWLSRLQCARLRWETAGVANSHGTFLQVTRCALGVLVLVLALVALPAGAQTYPSQTIKLIVPLTAGADAEALRL